MSELTIMTSLGSIDVFPNTILEDGQVEIEYFRSPGVSKHTCSGTYALTSVLSINQFFSSFAFYTNHPPYAVHLSPREYSLLFRDATGEALPPKPPLKCECGSTVAKLPTHSSWCPVKS